jgi:hypothetical protein
MEQTVSIAAPTPLFARPLRVIAQVVSYLVHPLFIPAYMAAALLFWHPIIKLLLPHEIRIRIMAMVLINTVLFPGLIVFLLYRLRFINNLYMETMKERIIPLTAGLIFYFWAYYVGRNLDVVPPALQQWLLGVFLCSCAAMFTNIFKKISLHSLAIGGVVSFCGWQMVTDRHWPGSWLIIALLLAGLVGTARLIRQAHEPSDIYAGYLAALICQVAAGLVFL